MSQKIKVHFTGGPNDGQRSEYFTPLPNILVVHSKSAGWQDYHRKPNSTEYVFDATSLPPPACPRRESK